MLRPTFIAIALSTCLAAPAFAEDAAPETSIQLYSVGDLVSADALEVADWGKIPAEEWQVGHSRTIEALERLAALVEGMCTTKPAAVAAHRETLSLAVRHTAEGHREIEQLLKSLRTNNQPALRLTFQPLCTVSSMLIESLPKEKQERAYELLERKFLSAEEAQEARQLLTEPRYKDWEEDIHLVPGRKTSWGHPARPAAATARILPGTRSVQLRLDYVIDDIVDETVPVASQVFEIQEGASAVSQHYCDGGTIVWLITPTILTPVPAEEAQAQVTAVESP